MTTVRDNTISITVRNGRGASGASLGDVTLGSGVSTALAIGVGDTGSVIVNGGGAGTPSSLTLTNATGLPLTTGVTGTLPAANGGTGITSLGTGVPAFLGTPSSANLKSALTDETGSGGAAVFATGPTITGLNLAAGSTSVAPLNLTSGTNLTTAAAGAVEYDGTVFYLSPAASSRAVSPSVYFVALSSTNTLTNNSSAQPIFDGGGGPANGAITLPVGLYFYDIYFQVSSLSGSSHDLTFSLGGTATIASIAGQSININGASVTLPVLTSTSATMQSASTNTTAGLTSRGVFRVSVAGTVIPQLTQATNTAAAVVAINSHFRCYSAGTNSAAYVGNWS